MPEILPSAQPEPAPSRGSQTAPVRAAPQRLPQRLRGRLTALGLVGALMVALPLVQVLRYQSAELQTLAGDRAGLDPVLLAVEVQRGLLAHAELAAEVLRGHQALEPQRKTRQRMVDERVQALGGTLAVGPWERAAHESVALSDDWSLLSRQVLERSVNDIESDQAHRLLVEEALQVIDLVGDSSAPRADRGSDMAPPAASTARALPRLAWQLARLTEPATVAGTAADFARELAAAEADVARTLGVLNTALARDDQPHRELADASASAGAAADRYLMRLRSLGPRDAETRAVGAAAVQAQFALFGRAHAKASALLDEQLAAARQLRRVLLGAMAALALVALALALQLARVLRALAPAAALSPPAPDEPPPAGTGRPGSREEAGRLLQRLREGDERHAADRRRRGGHREAQPTLPPEGD